MKKQERHGQDKHRALGLTLIAIGKAIKVLVLVVAGVAALVMAHRDHAGTVAEVASMAGVNPGHHQLHRLMAMAAGVSTRHLEEIGVGSFVYASVFAVEGTGLWLQRKWAEYLTVLVTLSFIPLEIYEIAHHFSAIKLTTLLLNVAALVYLVVRLMGERAHGRLGNASR